MKSSTKTGSERRDDLERAPQHHHPLGVEGVEDHEQDERAEPEARPVRERHQIREERGAGILGHPGERDGQHHDADAGGPDHRRAASLELLNLVDGHGAS
jgi:hypothetical protein